MSKDKYTLKSPGIKIQPSNEEDLWESDWIITAECAEWHQVGTVSFAGEKALGAVPISVNLEPRWQNRHIGTEVLKIMVDWAFLHNEVFEIKCHCDHENDRALHALQKASFIYRTKEGTEEYYSITKQKPSWLGLYVLIGVVIGLILGIVFGSLWIGFCAGIIACLLAGTALELQEKKYREKVRGGVETRK